MATCWCWKKGSVLKYKDELTKAMTWLSKQDNTIFLGQAVKYKGTAITNTLEFVPEHSKIEMPVCEEMQMGITIGLGLNGMVPISIFPRWNFLLLATNQIVNHLDKLKDMSKDKYKARVIIRTSVGSQRPMHPHVQHIGNYTDAFRLMCPNINIVKLEKPENILNEFKTAYLRRDCKPTILVEYGDYYNEQ